MCPGVLAAPLFSVPPSRPAAPPLWQPAPQYVSLDATTGTVGNVTVALLGQGVQDGFTEYAPFVTTSRPRWGNFACSSVDERGRLYFTTEFIAAPPCTSEQFGRLFAGVPRTVRQCFGTRTTTTNWATAVWKLKPQS